MIVEGLKRRGKGSESTAHLQNPFDRHLSIVVLEEAVQVLLEVAVLMVERRVEAAFQALVSLLLQLLSLLFLLL